MNDSNNNQCYRHYQAIIGSSTRRTNTDRRCLTTTCRRPIVAPLVARIETSRKVMEANETHHDEV